MAQKFDMDIAFTSSVLSLTTSIGALLFGQDLFSYIVKNPDELVMDLLIRLLIYILIPITFFPGTKLLFLLFFVPSDGEIHAVRMNRLTKASATMALTTLLVGLGIAVYILLPEAIAAWWFPW